MTDSDDDRPVTGRSSLVLREEQARFLIAPGIAAERSDAILTLYATATVDRLAALVASAVRASDDRRATTLDALLRQAEALLGAIERAR